MAKAIKDHVLKRDLQRIVEQEVPGDPERKTVSETIALRLTTKALAGNLDAIEIIYDRLLGKATQQIQHTGDEGGPIQYENLSMDALVQRLMDVVGNDTLEAMLKQRGIKPVTIDAPRLTAGGTDAPERD